MTTPRPPRPGRPRPAAAGPWRPPAGTAAPWLHWLHRLLDPIVGPAFERQQRVNRALVEQSTERAAAAEGRWRHAEQTAAASAAYLGEMLAFQSRLLQYLQRITALVDTKDREVAGLMRRINEDNGAAIGGATAALEALADGSADCASRCRSSTAHPGWRRASCTACATGSPNPAPPRERRPRLPPGP